jgi:hypothetical protein
LYKKKEFSLIKKKNEVFEDNVDKPKVHALLRQFVFFSKKKKCFLEQQKKNFLEQ